MFTQSGYRYGTKGTYGPIMNKKEYIDFFKNYILGGLGMILHIPKYIFIFALLSIPFYVIPVSFFYLLFARSSIISLDSYVQFFSNFSMEGLSFFDQIGFFGIGLGVLFLISKVFPSIKNFNDYE